MARTQTAPKPPKLGTVYTARARCFNSDGELVGTCIDTPNGIAKAMMEHPEVTLARGQFGEWYTWRDMESRMRFNVAESCWRAA